MHLSFLNANWLRKYPFRNDARLVSDAGTRMPDDLISGCRLMVDAANMDVVISKVLVKSGVISIEFASGSDTQRHTTVLGTATGKILQDNQSLTIQPLVATFSGFVVIGNKDRLTEDQVYIFNWANGQLEPSVITVYSVPKIHSLKHNRQTLTGNVTISVSGLELDTAGNIINLAVLAPYEVASRQDKTSSLLTCNNSIIGGINSVSPIMKNAGGNIDIYGIAPVTIGVSAGTITVSTDKTVAEVCKLVNIPPTDEDSQYHGDVTTATEPEWITWPQFSSTRTS